MDPKDFVHIGTIKKANRKTGELVIILNPGNHDLSEDIKTVFLEIDGGLVPFFLVEPAKSGPDQLMVKLEDYTDPDKAHRLVGSNVFVSGDELPEESRESVFYQDITGFTVFDAAFGQVGIIEEVVTSPNQIILRVEHPENEILVPLVEEFIISADPDKKELHLDLPEGLIGLYLDK